MSPLDNDKLMANLDIPKLHKLLDYADRMATQLENLSYQIHDAVSISLIAEYKAFREDKDASKSESKTSPVSTVSFSKPEEQSNTTMSINSAGIYWMSGIPSTWTR